MENPTNMGMNRTGIDMSPIDVKELLTGTEQTSPSSFGDEQELALIKNAYIMEAEAIGSVPVPGTVKGLAKSTLKKMTGNKPEVLIDKLAERLAFERTGTRLYDALINKCLSLELEPDNFSVETLVQFRVEESHHFKLMVEALEYLGADPTCQTPAADIVGVESAGVLQVLNDPRTSLEQCLHAILVAELADNAGWQLLVQLTEQMGLNEMAIDFGRALAEEDNHLDYIQRWHAQTVLSQAEGKELH